MRRVHSGSLGLLLGIAGCGRIAFDPFDGDAAIPGGAMDGTTDGAMVPATSCATQSLMCGPSGNVSCCDSPLVPGGTFLRSYDVGTDNMFPDMTNPATLSAFRLDRYEVTVGRFRQFVDAGLGTQQSPPVAGSGAHPRIANTGWDPAWNPDLPSDLTMLRMRLACDARATWTNTPGANENLPINCVNWSQMMAFCAWDGGFLPTTAEWNYAAAGGAEQRAFPWSTPPSDVTLDCTRANYYNNGAFCTAPTDRTTEVGSFPAGDGPWGHADLSGNIYELVYDASTLGFVKPCDDCADLTSNGLRTIVGGGFQFQAGQVRPAYRGTATQNGFAFSIGVRCARLP